MTVPNPSAPNSPAQSDQPLLPMGSVLLGLLTYSVMDVVMKGLSIELGAYNTILWRLMAAFTLVATLFLSRRPKMPSKAALKIHLRRALLTTGMSYLFFWGLARVPLAEAIALSFIAPIIALILSALFLGERIGRNAIIASLLGFSGILVIASGRFSGDYSQDSLMGMITILLSAVLYAGNLVVQRQQALIANPLEISFFQNLIMGSCFLLFAPFFAVIPPIELAPKIIAAATLSVTSALFIAWGYRRAEAQKLINLEYSAFIWAAIFGWLFFREPITLATIVGTILIVAGCVLTTRRDRPVAHVETTVI